MKQSLRKSLIQKISETLSKVHHGRPPKKNLSPIEEKILVSKGKARSNGFFEKATTHTKTPLIDRWI
jgi:DNA topoisomerase VI subunit B